MKDQDATEKLIDDTESLQDSKLKKHEIKLDATEKVGKCKTLQNKLGKILSILKPEFPLHYKNGLKLFNNGKILGISLAVLVLIGFLSLNYISEIGKITLVQTYPQ